MKFKYRYSENTFRPLSHRPQEPEQPRPDKLLLPVGIDGGHAALASSFLRGGGGGGSGGGGGLVPSSGVGGSVGGRRSRAGLWFLLRADAEGGVRQAGKAPVRGTVFREKNVFYKSDN